jgi:nucleotide-binding universal stress UspA family protein
MKIRGLWLIFVPKSAFRIHQGDTLMTNSSPQRILCAVRSRPGSEETVERAIELALQTGGKLIFCQIVDTNFINRFSARGSARKVAHRELTDMAEFALSIIRDNAEQAGVEEVDTIVRSGSVRPALLNLAEELDADLMVLGRSKSTTKRDVFDQSGLDEFAAELEALGLQVSR